MPRKAINKRGEYRPHADTIRKVVEHLESIGLEVAGPNVNLETGQRFPAMRNYDGDEVVKYRQLVEKDALWYDEEAMYK